MAGNDFWKDMLVRSLYGFSGQVSQDHIRNAELCISHGGSRCQRYTLIQFEKILSDNLMLGKDNNLNSMITAFDFLLKYAINLVKPARPLLWRSINTSNSAFKARVTCMKGFEHILQIMGYTEREGNFLQFPDHVLEPDVTKLTTIIAELLMAKLEVEQLNEATTHHQQQEISRESALENREGMQASQNYGDPIRGLNAQQNTALSVLKYRQPSNVHLAQSSLLRHGVVRQHSSVPPPVPSMGVAQLKLPADLDGNRQHPQPNQYSYQAPVSGCIPSLPKQSLLNASSINEMNVVGSKPQESVTLSSDAGEHDIVLENLRRRRLELKKQHENVNTADVVRKTQAEPPTQEDNQSPTTTTFLAGESSQLSAEGLKVDCLNCNHKVLLGSTSCNHCHHPVSTGLKHDIQSYITDFRSTTEHSTIEHVDGVHVLSSQLEKMNMSPDEQKSSNYPNLSRSDFTPISNQPPPLPGHLEGSPGFTHHGMEQNLYSHLPPDTHSSVVFQEGTVSPSTKDSVHTDKPDHGSDSDTESVCSTVSASSSVMSVGEKTKLFATFPHFITTSQLYAHFSNCGFDATEVKIRRHTNHSTGNPSGKATLFVSEPDDFISIVSDTLLLQKHRIKVKVYQRQQKKQQSRKTPSKDKSVLDQSANIAEPLLSEMNPLNPPLPSPTYSCRIFVGSRLPTYINEQHIREHFKVFEGSIVRVDTIRDRETKESKGYFFVTFQSQVFADMAVQNFNHTLLLGKHKLKVENEKPRPSSAVNEKVMVPSHGYGDMTVTTQSSAPTLIVDNLDPTISDEDIKAYIGIPVVSINTTGAHSQRCIRFHSDHDASMARNKLDGKNFLGKVIRVVAQERGNQLNTKDDHKRSPRLYQKSQEQATQMAANPHYQPGVQLFTPDAKYQSQPHGARYELSTGLTSNKRLEGDRLSLSAYPRKQMRDTRSGEDMKLLKLEPSQWNQMMTVQANGRSLYHEITLPFQTHPHVKFDVIAKSCTIQISGVPTVVASALECFQRHISTDIKVADRIKMEAIVDQFPNLPRDMASKYGITMSGYEVESTVIHFDGPSVAKSNALTEVNKLFASVLVSNVRVTYSMKLVPSLRKRLRSEAIQAFVKPADLEGSSNQVIVCSFNQSIQERGVKFVCSSPLINKVNTCTSDVEQLKSDQSIQIIEDEFLVSIQSEEDNTKLVVSGFCPGDVQTARKKLISLLKEISNKRRVHRFSPEENKYLKYVHDTSPHLFSDLQVKMTREGMIEFIGSSELIDMIISKQLLADLKWKRYSMKCSPRFQDLIINRVISPLKHKQKLNFVYLVDRVSRRQSQSKGRQGRALEPHEFSIMIYSKDPSSFCQVCESLDSVNPTSKHYRFRYRESLQCVSSMKTKLESVYLVQVNETERGAYINGLTSDDVQKCWDDIDEDIRSTVVLTRTIASSSYESFYLKEKYSEELKNKYACDIIFIKGRSELRARGKLKDIEALETRVSEILESGVHNEKFTVVCNARHISMWKRWWMDLKKQQEDSEVVFNFFYKDRRQPHNSDSNTEVRFELTGPDIEQLQTLKETLSKQEVEERTVQVSASGATALLTAKKQGKLDSLPVSLFIDLKANQVIVTSPKGQDADLDAVVEEIQKFVGNYSSTHINLTSEEPVVGLILNSRTKSAPYFAEANAIAKPHKVSVHSLKPPLVGLRLTGSKAAIAKVDTHIQVNVIGKIEANIEQVTVTLSNKQSCLLTSPQFSKFESKLKEESCVACSYPKVGNQSKVVLSAFLHSNPPGDPVQLCICRGSIVYERVDAIINPANESLKHFGGLAKIIVEAAGLTVQTESNTYVQRNGKLSPGTCVALGAGALPCKRIIHAVGPRWVDGTKGEERSLYCTVFKSLQCANEEKLSSIALPAISTGIFQVPEDICARASLQAVQSYFQAFPNSTLRNVRFVLFTPAAFQSFQTQFLSLSLPSTQSVSLQTKDSVTSKPNASASTSASGQWLWEGDKGSFCTYSPDISAKLQLQYQQNSKGRFQCVINGKMYEIDFSTMTQKNLQTRFKRNIRLQSVSGQSVYWEFTNDNASWTPYQPQESQIIETKYQANSQCLLTIRGNIYSLDFATMNQINVQTRKTRKIRRVIPTPVLSPSSALHEPIVNDVHAGIPVQMSNPTDDEKQAGEDVTVILRGPGDTLLQAKQKFENNIKLLFKSRSVAFPAALEGKLLKVVKRHNVISSVVSVSKSGQRKPQKRIKIEGLFSNVDRAISAIQDEIITSQLDSEEESSLEYPPEWEQQSKTTQVFNVQQGMHEWNRVATLFKATMPNSNITQIQRIQNKWLWERYVFQRKRLQVKNSGNFNEMELFHGTRNNDPKVIYENEDGFDMRYSAQGMWGQANYFAVNASYSHNYAHSTPGGYRELFLVKVLTGDSYDCPSNSALRKPPMKTMSTSSEVSFSQLQYDTVTGVTGGSRVYMTYDNDKAYPAYLIKYQ